MSTVLNDPRAGRFSSPQISGLVVAAGAATAFLTEVTHCSSLPRAECDNCSLTILSLKASGFAPLFRLTPCRL